MVCDCTGGGGSQAPANPTYLMPGGPAPVPDPPSSHRKWPIPLVARRKLTSGDRPRTNIMVQIIIGCGRFCNITYPCISTSHASNLATGITCQILDDSWKVASARFAIMFAFQICEDKRYASIA